MGKYLSLPYSSLKILKLDNNPFGTQGLKNLAYGIRTNPNLTKLSLKYCGIKADGVVYLQ